MPNEKAQEKLLLWVFVAYDSKIGELNHTYARTEKEARANLWRWISEQALLGRKDVEVKYWPGGFIAGHRAYWQGSISASKSNENEVGNARAK